VNAKFDQNISATKDDFSMEIIGKGRIKGTVRE
jgi:hypothetical protein